VKEIAIFLLGKFQNPTEKAAPLNRCFNQKKKNKRRPPTRRPEPGGKLHRLVPRGNAKKETEEKEQRGEEKKRSSRGRFSGKTDGGAGFPWGGQKGLRVEAAY